MPGGGARRGTVDASGDGGQVFGGGGCDGRGRPSGGAVDGGGTAVRPDSGDDHRGRRRFAARDGVERAEADLMSWLHVMLQEGELRIARELPVASPLRRKLLQIRAEAARRGGCDMGHLGPDSMMTWHSR